MLEYCNTGGSVGIMTMIHSPVIGLLGYRQEDRRMKNDQDDADASSSDGGTVTDER